MALEAPYPNLFILQMRKQGPKKINNNNNRNYYGPVWNTYHMSHGIVVFVECDGPHSPMGQMFNSPILDVGLVNLGGLSKWPRVPPLR